MRAHEVHSGVGLVSDAVHIKQYVCEIRDIDSQIRDECFFAILEAMTTD